MFTIHIDLPDAHVASLAFDPNDLDALRQTILLGLDAADDSGLDVSATRLLLAATRDYV